MGTSLDLTSTLPQQHTSRRRPDPAKRTGHRRSRLPIAYAVLLDPRPTLMLLVVRVTTRTTASILYGTCSVAEVKCATGFILRKPLYEPLLTAILTWP